MLIAVKSKRFSVTGYKRMFVILIIKTLGSGFKYSTFDYCAVGLIEMIERVFQSSHSEAQPRTHVLRRLSAS